jgi:hypothetical protein
MHSLTQRTHYINKQQGKVSFDPIVDSRFLFCRNTTNRPAASQMTVVWHEKGQDKHWL